MGITKRKGHNTMTKNVKRIICIVAAVLVGGLCFTAGTKVGAASAQPGSQSDPLVTLSYLNSRLEGTSSDSGQASTSVGFKQIKLTSGQKLTLKDGSEVVVYSGNGKVFGTTGLLSLTGGELFSSGNSVVLYTDYLAIGGNSGIEAKGNMTVYVRGGYEA